MQAHATGSRPGKTSRPHPVRTLVALLPFAAALTCGPEATGGSFVVTMTPTGAGLEGSMDLDGNVRFPITVPTGTPAHLRLFTSRPTDIMNAAAVATGSARVPSDDMTFRIRSISRGTYFLSVWVDTDRDGALSAGDLTGFFEGSLLTPNAHPATATALEVRRSLSGVDFALAIWP